MWRSVVLAVVLLVPALAVGQEPPVRWRSQPRAAISEAQRTLRPLMVYVLASTRRRDDDIERAQKQAMHDQRFLALTEKFVPLQLSRSVHREVLSEFGLPEHANMMISFVAPDGTSLGTLSALGVAQADSLVQKMRLVLERYNQQVFREEIKPRITDKDTPPKDLRTALRLVRDRGIEAAAEDVLAMLEWPRLATNVRKDVYETLAALSTKATVEKLIELSRGGDALATRALDECTPVGAEYLMAEVKADAEPFPYAFYEAAAKICNIRKTKPERYFENAKLRMKTEEVERVRELVKRAADRWREVNK